MISVNSTSSIVNIFHVLLCDVLCAILTFKRGFQDLIIKHKSIMLIADIGTDLSRINLDIHEYKLDSDVELPTAPNSALSSPPGTPPLSARVCAVFIDVATKTKPISKAAAKEQEKAILQQRAKEMVELLKDSEFPLRTFKLDRQCLPLMVPNIVDVIGLKYGRLSLRAKTIFYMK